MMRWMFKFAWIISLLMCVVASAVWIASYRGFLPYYFSKPSLDVRLAVSTFPGQSSVRVNLSKPLSIDWNRPDPIVREQRNSRQNNPLPGLILKWYATTYFHSSGRNEIADETLDIDLRYALAVAQEAAMY